MNEYQSDRPASRHKRRNQSRQQALRIFLSVPFTLFCCLAVLAVGLKTNDSLFMWDKQPSGSLASSTSETAPLPAYGDAAADDAPWHLILVNKWNPIPDDYEVELVALPNGQLVDIRIYPPLQDMLAAAERDGVYPVVGSGYRTAQQQQRLLDEKTAAYKAEGYPGKEAEAKAQAWVALPGTSEHQLGIAVDINADGIHSTNQEVYQWLQQNSYQFGFICRYPADKTDLTGIINEPWHYRYVGIEAATNLYYQGVCLEEYLEQNERGARDS